jgi:hypothetical protein
MTRLLARFAALTLALATLAPARALTQTAEVPSLGWRTITTPNFRVHYEPQLEAWARDVAAQMEAVRAAVAARVGYTPPQVIDLIVEDPLNTANGSAWPSLQTPAMRFWATPPAPSSVLGSSRSWGEILAVHEYAHLAHLLRPSRRRLTPLLLRLTGLPVGPLVTVPAWVSEGYATVIEGELTGAGRPNGIARPAILRQFALEGRLPSYGGLDASGGFLGGSMRYLVGSAYLEWLQAQRGDSSLPHLWRRATARQKRKFPEAFRGVFGESPDVLYGRFASEVAAKAHAVRDALDADSLARGTLVQHWLGGIGAPAISPDGKRIAVRRSPLDADGRVVVLSLEPAPLSAEDSLKREKQREARRKKDPLDIEAISIYPEALKAEATLHAVNGGSYDAPRWFTDGTRLLVVRAMPTADGRVRPDLFVWDTERNDVRRVTRRAGVMMADPFPDGDGAAALVCGAGTCSVARVDLASGTVRVIAQGALDHGFHGVRVSPDGLRIASARQRGSRWYPVVISVATGTVQELGPDDGASRYTAAWESDSTLIVVSEASGVASLERIRLDARTTPTMVARTTGAIAAPDVGPDGRVWWLDFHARGYDLRVTAAGQALAPAPQLAAALAPAAPRTDTTLAVTFARAELPEDTPYGVGPFGATMFFTASDAADGDMFSLALSAGDPLARWSAIALAGTATEGAWKGFGGSLTWRGFLPEIEVSGWNATQDPSRQLRNGGGSMANFGGAHTGIAVSTSLRRTGTHGTAALRLGASRGNLDLLGTGSNDLARDAYFAEFQTQQRFTPSNGMRVQASLRGHFSRGTLSTVDWQRVTGTASIGLATRGGVGLNGRIFAGQAETDTPLEMFIVGGSSSPYIEPAVLSHRVEYPGLPLGARLGRRVAILTAETTGPLRLYHDWIAAAPESYGGFSRVIGAELAMPIPRVAVARLPALQPRLGVSHSLNGRFANATIAYISLRIAR